MRANALAIVVGVLGTLCSGTRLPGQDDGGDPQLKAAIRLLFRGRSEAEVREGAQLCLRRNDAAAIELLLKVLENPQPHYRDIVWEALPGFTDHYARRRVADELKRNRQNAGVRHWCAELLGIWGEADWVAVLLPALKDRDDEVARTAARSLGMIGHANASKGLEAVTRAKDPQLRANAIEALARIDPVAYGQLFHGALADPDGGVRCALLGAAPSLYPPEVEGLARTALTDKDWRPRMQAVDNLAERKTKPAIDALIVALEDPRPVVRLRANDALQKLTGKRYSQLIEWKAWWKDNAATFDFTAGADGKPGAAGEDTRAAFNGIRVDSDHCFFLLDRTLSMEQPLVSKGASKREAAAEEFDATLGRLIDRELRFNVAVYNDELTLFAKKPVLLNKRSQTAATKFARGADPRGNKDIWNAVRSAVSDPETDTVFLLSSGEPEIGHYVHWNRVTRQLAELNRFHKVVVHTVVYSEVEWYREQLEKLAASTGGSYKAFQ